MGKTIEFFVRGLPHPSGSKVSFLHSKTGRIITKESSPRSGEWRECVKYAAQKAYQGPPIENAVRLDVTFYIPRPKTHYGTGKNKANLKKSAPPYPIAFRRLDRDKLLRNLQDALTEAAIWRDDSLAVTGDTSKFYAHDDTPPGAWIRIEELTE